MCSACRKKVGGHYTFAVVMQVATDFQELWYMPVFS